MSPHVYHEGQPNYSPEQILHDGCDECAFRGRDVSEAIAHLDGSNFARAWKRAAEWNTTGARDICETEMPLLNALWSLQLQLERLGVPIGQIPNGEFSGLFGGAR